MSISGEWVDPDDAPELSGEWFDKAAMKMAGQAVRGGRSAEAVTSQVTLRIDTDVLDRFRATGPGWQARINQALRRAALEG